jgi:Bacterial regulatory proteins, luxR family
MLCLPRGAAAHGAAGVLPRSRRLGVTEGTVRKHLENIYSRLQVSSRAAAVSRVFGPGAAA